jgi:hypothetical protein
MSEGRQWWRHPVLVAALSVGVLAVVSGAGIGLITRSSAGTATSATSTSTKTAVAGGPPCPLTGAPSPTGSVPNRPALAVKVDNYPAARPQSGLDHADVVFEEPVEGGITRLVAVFQCQGASIVGPIRSAREPDVAIVDELSDPVFVHVGGIDPILRMIANADDQPVDCCQPSIIERIPGRVAPYSTYASTSSLWGLFPSDTTPPKPIFSYSSAYSGSPVSAVRIPFSPTNDNTWRWQASTGRWDLSIGGVPATLTDGNTVSVTNVVVMVVQTFEGPWVENAQGAHEVEVDPTSGGPVEVLRDGVDIQGTWSRSSLSAPATFADSSGNPITLAPGTTWVELVPSNVTVTSSPATSSTTSASAQR